VKIRNGCLDSREIWVRFRLFSVDCYAGRLDPAVALHSGGYLGVPTQVVVQILALELACKVRRLCLRPWFWYDTEVSDMYRKLVDR